MSETAKKRIDLRGNEWREAIVAISNAVKGSHLTDRALALLIVDSCNGIGLTQALVVLKAIKSLERRYLR